MKRINQEFSVIDNLILYLQDTTDELSNKE